MRSKNWRMKDFIKGLLPYFYPEEHPGTVRDAGPDPIHTEIVKEPERDALTANPTIHLSVSLQGERQGTIMNKSKKGTIRRLLEVAKPCRGLLTSAVVLAVLGSFSGILPYIAVSRMIADIMNGRYSFGRILFLSLIALLGYLASLWLNTASTIRSHRAAFTVLKNIRKAISVKLSRVPMGTILDTPSGKYKAMLVDVVEKLELPLAHISNKNMDAAVVEYIGGIQVIKTFRQGNPPIANTRMRLGKANDRKQTGFVKPMDFM